MKILLLSPVFHGYWDSIADGFSQDGHVVETYTYDAAPRLYDKALNKIRTEIPAKFHIDTSASHRQKMSFEVENRLRSTDADLVVVVKGDLIFSEAYEVLRRRKIPAVLWLYDELRRTHYTLDDLNVFGSVGTYSTLDRARLCELGIPAYDLPLAFDNRMVVTGPPRGNKIVFVGARYRNREETLASLHSRGVPLKAYGREWSPHLSDRLRTLRWDRPDVPSGPDLARSEAAQISYDAIGVVNIHGDQDGFNMRTFEVCGVGGIQFLDREDVTAFYEPGRELLTFRNVNHLAELVSRIQGDDVLATTIRRAAQKRTLAEHTFVHRCRAVLAHS